MLCCVDVLDRKYFRIKCIIEYCLSVLFTNNARGPSAAHAEKIESLLLLASVLFVNKTRTQQSPTHLIYDLSSLPALI